MPNMASTFSN